MKLYVLRIAYSGKGYHGLVPQKGKKTILGILFEKIGKPLEWEVVSRTDKDVNAFENYVKLIYNKEVKFPKKINNIYILNVWELKENIKIKDFVEWKEYLYLLPKEIEETWIFKPKYLILNGKKIIVRKREKIKNININAVRIFEKEILGCKSFHNFTIGFPKNSICCIYDFKFEERENYFEMRIRGNRFLQQMIRKIVSFTLSLYFDLFKEEYIPMVFKGILEPKPPSAPGKFLYLKKVKFRENFWNLCEETYPTEK